MKLLIRLLTVKASRHGDDGLSIGRKGMKPIFDFMETAQKEQKPFFVWYAPMEAIQRSAWKP